MALAKWCPECEKEINDQATVCPNCGKPLIVIQSKETPPTKLPKAKKQHKPFSKRTKRILFIILIFWAIVGVFDYGQQLWDGFQMPPSLDGSPENFYTVVDNAGRELRLGMTKTTIDAVLGEAGTPFETDSNNPTYDYTSRNITITYLARTNEADWISLDHPVSASTWRLKQNINFYTTADDINRIYHYKFGYYVEWLTGMDISIRTHINNLWYLQTFYLKDDNKTIKQITVERLN